MADQPTASEIFKAALCREIDSLKVLDQHAFMQACVDIVQVPECNPDPDRLLIEHLSDRAEAGSLPAVAALNVMSWTHPEMEPRAFDAIKAAALRSDDVRDAALLDGMTALLEEWAEEEVAAGRMVRTVDPKSGHNLYSMPPRKRPKKPKP